MTATLAVTLRRLDRTGVQPHLGLLDAWLLPGAPYRVQHTWPQLYRSDGEGTFLGLFAGERLLSHCACRFVELCTGSGPRRVALLGSVATDPALRGQGLASRLLRHALDDSRQHGAAAALLWAERPGLYARAGFVPGPPEACLLLAPGAAPGRREDGARVRAATVHDHAALHALHARKPLRVARDLRTMSGLLTTPGMTVLVLERAGHAVAYACCGKGADLQDWWHELGGEDADVARLLAPAAETAGARGTAVLVPPYRKALAALLAPWCAGSIEVAGPMVRTLASGLEPPFWIDGLDSV